MPVDSLVDMSLRACSKISKRIRDIGGMPYNVARPFLLKIDNPEQLHALEEKCEQIIGHDAEIWLALIKRDIPNWETKNIPCDSEASRELYQKLKKEARSEMDAGADQLKAALNDKNEKQLAEIKPVSALAKRGPSLQSRIAYGYQSGRTGSKGSSKLGVLEKIKKEARDAKAARALAEQQMRKRMATTVARAPAHFVEDVRTQRQRAQQSPERPPRPPMAIRRPQSSTSTHPPSRPVAVTSPSRPAITQQQIQEREARLRALTSEKPLPTTNAPRAPPRKHHLGKETPILSAESPSTPRAKQGVFSASFLEEASPPSGRKMLGDVLGRRGSGPGAGNGSRSASPQLAPMVRKRKKDPELFMAPAKRKAVATGGNAALR